MFRKIKSNKKKILFIDPDLHFSGKMNDKKRYNGAFFVWNSLTQKKYDFLFPKCEQSRTLSPQLFFNNFLEGHHRDKNKF